MISWNCFLYGERCQLCHKQKSRSDLPWEKHQYVDAAKVKRFAVMVQCCKEVSILLGATPVKEEDAWEPSKAWVTAFLKSHRITSHTPHARPSSRDRDTMEAELKQVDENYAKFDPFRLVTVDETGGNLPPTAIIAVSLSIETACMHHVTCVCII